MATDKGWGSALTSTREMLRARQLDRALHHWEKFLDSVELLGRDSDALSALAVVDTARDDLGSLCVPDLVRWSRASGATWDEVGHALGITKQAASKRWRHVDEVQG